MIYLLQVAANTVNICWTICYVITAVILAAGRRPPQVCRWLFHELRPFFLPATAISKVGSRLVVVPAVAR